MIKKLLVLLLLSSTIALVQAQPPRLKKYSIGETGCTVYLPSDPGEFEMSYSEDNSEVHTGEAIDGDFNFAVILVRFEAPLGDDEDSKNDMITAYLDFLQLQFEVTEAAGYGYGHTLESAPRAVGILDYWLGSDGTRFAVKAWCDSDFLAVLMLYGPDEYPIFNVQQMFLDGFRFPAD